MIEHLIAHPLGLIHVLLALAAIVAGTAVVVARKGTPMHRWTGRVYLFGMLGTNATALMLYELFGFFGPFHWMALASLVTVATGYLPVRRRTPGWKPQHAYWMVGSYVGLLAAAVAEIVSRVTAWPFALSVIASSAAIIFLGVWLMRRLIPKALSG